MLLSLSSYSQCDGGIRACGTLSDNLCLGYHSESQYLCNLGKILSYFEPQFPLLHSGKDEHPHSPEMAFFSCVSDDKSLTLLGRIYCFLNDFIILLLLSVLHGLYREVFF